jgi:hypothetical protein
MVDMIAGNLYEPFSFYSKTLDSDDPRASFVGTEATPGLQYSKKSKFWTARNGIKPAKWLPDASSTFDAVVHFVQSGSGTGVHVGGGLILTCAHVVDDGVSDEDNSVCVDRVGIQKVVTFPSGRTFLTACREVLEDDESGSDVAVVEIVAEIPIGSATRPASAVTTLPEAEVSLTGAADADKVFTVGNPSSIDLESDCSGGDSATVEFHPPTWHTSTGAVVSSSNKDGFLEHTAWTYWGHSGAPIFDARGHVVSLHCAWDDSTGMRWGQRWENLREVLQKARAPRARASKKRKK